jgi:hypothetical protein
MRNSKGTILDMSEMLIILFITAITLFVVFYVLGEIETPFIEAGMNTTSIDDAQSALTLFDSLMPLILAGLIFAIIISATMLDTHPAMFAFSILLFMVMLVLYMIIGNVFYEFSTTSDMLATRLGLPTTTLIFDNILFIGFVAGIIIMIALYAKYKSGSSGGTY